MYRKYVFISKKDMFRQNYRFVAPRRRCADCGAYLYNDTMYCPRCLQEEFEKVATLSFGNETGAICT